ncbi:TerC family protein [Sinorhizobium garamanticum]|uniref:TerC family protein n=1 Tax=Sinorhizobium garamanticum TaxID=680247 RepID=A0ABY8DM49_9HYPH|nr:TerC family protein [Sinorhizobium garamanticum]WEX90013.1 TerC family protein [Sinorhizobium garamanticum]
MDFFVEYAGQTPWLWLGFLCLIGLLLWVDLGIINRKDEVISPSKSALMWASFAAIAVLFGAYLGLFYEPDPQYYTTPTDLNRQAVVQYVTGYLLETALAFDNIFVISLIFNYFCVPRAYQHRVLFWGIIGAIVFRGIFISLGAAVVNSWTWVLYFFAIFLIYTGWKMMTGHGVQFRLEDNKILAFVRRHMRVTNEIRGRNFFIRLSDPATGLTVLYATPLFLALVMVETADVVFAVDSVPAIFAVTRDPFIVYTSNVFAILGLRSMYFMLAAAAAQFKYLTYGLSIVLVLIGAKVIWNFALSKELGWVPYLEPQWALLMTVVVIGGAIACSALDARRSRMSDDV